MVETAQGPRTEAGRALANDIGFHAFMDGTYIDDRITAIEAEAAEKALEDAAERVRAEIRGEEAIARLTGSVDSIALIAGMNRALAAVDPESQP